MDANKRRFLRGAWLGALVAVPSVAVATLAKGEKGDKGDDGIPGRDGRDGMTGPAGLPGTQLEDYLTPEEIRWTLLNSSRGCKL